MDSASQFSFNTRHGRNGNQSLNNDRQLSESSNPSSINHPRQNSLSSVCVGQSRKTYQNSTPSEQRSTTDPNAQFLKPATLHFEYHSRYPSPPTTQRSPNSLSSSPPCRPSPTLHRTNGSTSSAGSLSMITLPPLSTVTLPPRGLDQSPNHQHIELSSLPAMQRKPPLITQLPRNLPEQGAFRRHTLDSGFGPDPQLISGGRKRTLSTLPSPILRGKNLHSTATQQVPPQPPQLPQPPPPQPQPTKLTSRRYSSPPPLPNSRHDNNPPASATSQSPISPSMSQPPQISQSSQLAATDGPSSITSLDEASDVALEPLRLGFENIWAETVQNVRQVMGKMQKDLSRVNAAEGRKNVNLMRCLVTTSEKLKSQEWAVDELRKENSTLMEKALENEQLRRESNQKRTMMDALNEENHKLRRENEELRKKNEEVKEALTRAAEFIFQYKEELAKVKVDAETFRKCREASVLSANDQSAPAAADLHREITRLHAEKERERIFNNAVKQLRALTALEDFPCTATRERDSEEELNVKADNRRSGSSSFEVSTSKQNPSSPLPEHPRQSTPPSATQVVSTDNEEKCKVEGEEPGNREMDSEVIDVEMDGEDEDVTIIPPISTTTSNPVVKPEAEQDVQLPDEARFNEEEQGSQSDLEMQRQRQRQARRGPTPCSSPQTRSKKSLPVVSKTGVKRDREEFEEGQVDEDDSDHDVGVDEPGIIPEDKPDGSPVHSSISTERQATLADAAEDESEKGVIKERELKEDMPRRQKDKKVSTTGRQVTPQKEIKKAPTMKGPNPKALSKRSHYRDFISPPISLTNLRSFGTTPQQQSTASSPSTQARLPKKLGISHMDLLYKTEREVMVCRICLSLEQNPDATTAERRKSKANTQKFPLNASWADLINHCQTEHTKACEDMEKLSPSQLAEMKQRTR